MNVQKSIDKYSFLISYLESHGYSSIYISRFKTVMRRIAKDEKSIQNSRDFYERVYQGYLKRSKSKDYLRGIRSIIRIIRMYDIYGTYPDVHKKSTFLKDNAYDKLNAEFKEVVNFYEETEKLRKKSRTVYHEANNATTFFLYLQVHGCETLISILERAVLSVFYRNGEVCRSASYKKNIAAVLKANIIRDNIFKTILSYLPNLVERRKTIQYLAWDEVEKVKATLSDPDGRLSLRDRAIGTIVLYTGLRGCDITSLTIDDIDWDREIINIKQQKTEASLCLPLRPIVGNAIFDYIMQERPETPEYRHIFIRRVKPFVPLGETAMYTISCKIMKTAGIRHNVGDRRGLHIFRHHVATAMLGNNVSRPVISSTLGHISPDSLEIYLSSDFKHLKEYSLSIEEYPVNEKLFEL